MAKYRLMLIYTFMFFSVSMTVIILGTNATYEVASKRRESPPAAANGESWLVQKTTKGHPPVKIITRSEWRQGTADAYETSYTRKIHWPNIAGVTAFSAFMSGMLVFIGAFMLVAASKVKLPKLSGKQKLAG